MGVKIFDFIKNIELRHIILMSIPCATALVSVIALCVIRQISIFPIPTAGAIIYGGNIGLWATLKDDFSYILIAVGINSLILTLQFI